MKLLQMELNHYIYFNSGKIIFKLLIFLIKLYNNLMILTKIISNLHRLFSFLYLLLLKY